jgi:hypothetical protein
MPYKLITPAPEDEAAPRKKRYRLVETEVGAKADRSDAQPLTWKETLDDYANAVGSGMTKGVIGVGGMFGDAREMQKDIIRWGGNKLGVSPETTESAANYAQYLNPLTAFAPTSEQLTPEGAKAGLQYDPKSTGAHWVKTGAEIVPGMLMGPGGAVQKGIQTAATTAGTELAGPWGGVVAAVLTGGRPTVRGSERIPNDEVVANWRTAKNAAYDAATQAGVRYTPQAFGDLVTDMGQALANSNINQLRHPRAVSMYQDIAGLQGHSPSMTDLDQLRQTIARDVVNSADRAERHFGQIMMDRIDDFIDHADPGMVNAGDPQQAAQLIQTAREYNQRYRKLEAVTTAVTKAERRAASTGSGGNADNQIRQNIRGILDSERKVRGFNPAEREAMDRVVRGTRTQNAVRLAGKLSPQGSGLMAALGIGGAMANPIYGIPSLVGLAAKPLAERMTQGNVDALVEALAGHGILRASPQRRAALIRALLGAEVAGQAGFD